MPALPTSTIQFDTLANPYVADLINKKICPKFATPKTCRPRLQPTQPAGTSATEMSCHLGQYCAVSSMPQRQCSTKSSESFPSVPSLFTVYNYHNHYT